VSTQCETQDMCFAVHQCQVVVTVSYLDKDIVIAAAYVPCAYVLMLYACGNMSYREKSAGQCPLLVRHIIRPLMPPLWCFPCTQDGITFRSFLAMVVCQVAAYTVDCV
jgi:hypothetical protein